MIKTNKSSWLKNRGYLHITPQIDVSQQSQEILNRLSNKSYVAKHAFYPLIHAVVKERRYKFSPELGKKCHSYNGIQTKKLRPLHYATHIDALIFGYYAEILQNKYEKVLRLNKILSESIIAYRKIEDPENIGKFKSTINFANEVFNAIRTKTILAEECIVLKFDIKNFFSSINHIILKSAWTTLLDEPSLPDDHYNVYKATTRFSYIMKDDLRLKSVGNGRRSGFDEKKLATIRKSGKVAFFESSEDFRRQIKNGSLKLHKYPFRDEDKKPMGIPQGLPISAVLANLYLLQFDNKVIDELVKPLSAFYRRYSDDIVIVCCVKDANYIEDKIQELIKESRVTISKDKTEKFIFKSIDSIQNTQKILSTRMMENGNKERFPFTYLGFEFNGEQALIKSSNLAKFYRRMKNAIKKKVHRAITVARANPGNKIVIYRNQLIRLYSDVSLDRQKIIRRKKTLIQTKYGYYAYQSELIHKKFKSNYFSYVRRSSVIMNEPSIKQQLKKHKGLFNYAISHHIKKALSRQ